MPNVMKYFNTQLIQEFNPDINGYTLAFMVPPDLSGLNISEPVLENFSKLIPFASVDFNPPDRQILSETVNHRSGAMPYAVDISNGEQCTVTYIDNGELDIFSFHHIWIEYMKELLEGLISPASKYIDPGSEYYGALDYATSLYFVKYDPTMTEIKYIGKATGIYPQNEPIKEILGQRTANELTTITFTYFCAYYHECMNNPSHWIYKELEQLALSRYEE